MSELAEPSSALEASALESRLARWRAAGLISQEQMLRIRAYEGVVDTGPPPVVVTSTGPRPAVVEALAYLGGVVIAAALMMITFGFWESMSPATRISIPAAATVVLLIGGYVLPRELGQVFVRVRGVLWLVSVATATATGAIIFDAAGADQEVAARVVPAAVLVYAAILLTLHRAITQQVGALVMVTYVAILLPDPEAGGFRVGVTIGVCGIAWAIAAHRGYLPGTGRYLRATGSDPAADPWTAGQRQRRWGIVLGAAVTGLAGVVLAGQWDVAGVGILPVLLVVGAGIVLGDLAVLVCGALAMMIALPMVADRYLGSTLAVALVLLVTGTVLVGAAILVARRRRTHPTPDSRAAPASGTGDAASTSSSTRSGGSARG